MKKIIQNELIELLYKLFANDCISKDIIIHFDLIEDLNIDSLTFVSLLVEIEKRFKIKIPEENIKIDLFRNVDDITNMIYQLKLGENNE